MASLSNPDEIKMFFLQTAKDWITEGKAFTSFYKDGKTCIKHYDRSPQHLMELYSAMLTEFIKTEQRFAPFFASDNDLNRV